MKKVQMAALLDGVLKAQDEVLTVMFAAFEKEVLMNSFVYILNPKRQGSWRRD